MSAENGVSTERQNYLWKEQGRSEYVWPASRMVWQNIMKLTRIGNFLKRPINQVLVDAAEAYAAAILPILEGKSIPLGKQERETIANGVLVWQDATMSRSDRVPSTPSQDELVATINELRQEVKVLRQAIDELREAYEYAMRNQQPPNSEPSMPSSDEVASDSLPTKKEERQPTATAFRIAEETTGRQLELF